jgi:phenylpropionate dioxygenase-like ring-hydroxylating dioxygenase large terminal subunit
MSLERACNDWYAVAIADRLSEGDVIETRLLETELRVSLTKQGDIEVKTKAGAPCAAQVRYGHVWACLGEPAGALFDIPEADQEGRTLVDCGAVRVRCSPLRAVENFLDVAHFPYVHTDILGAEPHTEVERYKVEIREDVDEVWATDVRFFQPQAAKSAAGGITTHYMYRVPAPTTAILYKTCPPRPGEWDVIAIFVQPLSEDLSDVWAWMALFDDETPMTDLIHFQQMIFLQDRTILENQIPKRLPLDPKMEVPTRADLTSVTYRRWLRQRGHTYGAFTQPA